MIAGPAWRTAVVEGASLWAPALPGWEYAAAALGPGSPAAPASAAAAAPARPAPRSLATNERRRAPDSVLAALQVAEEAVAQAAAGSGRSAATLASVFTSAHGDLPILDAMLRTLAGEPQLLSPTRFHHSVHNAPSGYWAIASGSHAPSTALAAFDHSAGAGLLEALVHLASEQAPVLVVGCDTGAVGPLTSVNASRGLLAWAMVLGPAASQAARPNPCFALQWRIVTASNRGPAAAHAADATNCAAQAIGPNPQADVLPLFAALVARRACTVALRCGAQLTLELQVQPQADAGQGSASGLAA
jgi:hypothetical protein